MYFILAFVGGTVLILTAIVAFALDQPLLRGAIALIGIIFMVLMCHLGYALDEKRKDAKRKKLHSYSDWSEWDGTM